MSQSVSNMMKAEWKGLKCVAYVGLLFVGGTTQPAGSSSQHGFQIMSFKPLYSVPDFSSTSFPPSTSCYRGMKEGSSWP